MATNRDVIVFFELVMVLKTSCFKKKNNLADEEIFMKSKVMRKLLFELMLYIVESVFMCYKM